MSNNSSKKRITIGKVELDDFAYHELLDRLTVAINTLDNNVVQHSVAKIETEIKNEITLAIDHLFRAQQLTSQKRFKN